jgi:hypothetical protein
MFTTREKYICLGKILRPLEPIFHHGIKIIYTAIIIFITSKMLHFILPPDYLHNIEKIELYFYLAVTILFGIYTFILLCLNLAVHLLSEFFNTIKAIKNLRNKINNETETKYLPEPSIDDEDYPSPARRIIDFIKRRR